MKRFSLFLTEAGTSQASTQAKKLNLKSDGHGSWFDSRGNLVAVTDKGRLKFTNKKQPKAQEGPVKQMATRRADDKLAGAPKQQPAPKPKAKVAEPEGDAKSGGGDTLTTAFGRFNPPTIGHEKLLKAAKKAAAGGALKIYPSRTQDSKKNPLDPDMKVSYMRKMFPDFEEQIINDPDMRSIFDVLVAASEEGYKNVNIIVGADRQAEFDNLAQKYNGELYNFDLIRVISAGVRDADAEGVSGMSASKMRKAVVDDDFQAFRKGTPKGIDDGDAQALYNAVRIGMKVKAASKVKEDFATWKIAPRYDQQTLREQYVTKKVFRIGDLVENLNTGLVGKIIRRGTNYLICVTEQDNMFKSWIRDVMEAVVNYSGPSGVPASERGVGTDSLRQYAMDSTGTKKIRNFINRYRKNKK
jgi:nicotinamide mononucleotide adenylyltransferase